MPGGERPRSRCSPNTTTSPAAHHWMLEEMRPMASYSCREVWDRVYLSQLAEIARHFTGAAVATAAMAVVMGEARLLPWRRRWP